MRTKEKLARALVKAGAPVWMVVKAKDGGYDDYESESATPISDLVRDCTANKMIALATRAAEGEFDATFEELLGKESPDGQRTFEELLRAPREEEGEGDA